VDADAGPFAFIVCHPHHAPRRAVTGLAMNTSD